MANEALPHPHYGSPKQAKKRRASNEIFKKLPDGNIMLIPMQTLNALFVVICKLSTIEHSVHGMLWAVKKSHHNGSLTISVQPHCCHSVLNETTLNWTSCGAEEAQFFAFSDCKNRLKNVSGRQVTLLSRARGWPAFKKPAFKAPKRPEFMLAGWDLNVCHRLLTWSNLALKTIILGFNRHQLTSFSWAKSSLLFFFWVLARWPAV